MKINLIFENFKVKGQIFVNSIKPYHMISTAFVKRELKTELPYFSEFSVY